MTTYEMAGRNKKAAALADVFRRAGISGSMLRDAMTPDTWRRICREANVRNLPSDETVAVVVDILDQPCAICQGFGLSYCTEDHEPLCTCRQVDVDVVDSRDCELCNPQSRFSRAWSAHNPKPEPVMIVDGISEECPF